MKRTVLIRGARQLLTLHGSGGPRRGDGMRQLAIIEDGALLISGGIITHVGPSRRIENLAQARSAEEINASGRVVMPAFVDSHTHLIASPPRVSDGRLSARGETDLPTGREATQQSIEHIRRTSAPALEHQAKRFLSAFVRHGTTTVEVKSGYGLDESGEMKMLRVMSHLGAEGFGVVPTFMAPHTPPPDFKGTADEHFVWVCEHLLPKVKTRKLARFVDGFCDTAGLSLPKAHALLNAARRLGLPTKLHTEYSTRMGPVRMAVEMGAVSVDGLSNIDSSDAGVLSQSRTIGVVMPGAMHQGYTSRLPPARELIDRGVALALASGFNPPVSSTYNMMTVMAIACTHMKLSAEEAITASTINAAYAVGVAEKSGSLQFDKDADLIMLNVSDYREIPYQFGVNLVSLTMRKGQVVYREGAVSWDGE